MSRTTIHQYPDPHKIEINEANFELILKDNERYFKNMASWSDLLLIVSAWAAWAMLYSSRLDDLWIFSGEQIKGAFFVLILIGTLAIGGRIVVNIYKSVMLKTFKGMNIKDFKKIITILFRHEHTPEGTIRRIKEKCQNCKI